MMGHVILGFGCGLMLMLVAADGGEGGRRYFRIIYDYEVAAQCGYVSEAVENAFRIGRDDEAARTGLGTEPLRRLRIKAIVAAAREYDNRGLGGYRAWCATEGREGVGLLRSAR